MTYDWAIEEVVILFLGFSCVNIIFVKCLWLCFPGSPRRMAGFYFCPNMLYILKHIRFMHGKILLMVFILYAR